MSSIKCVCVCIILSSNAKLACNQRISIMLLVAMVKEPFKDHRTILVVCDI